MEHWSVRCVLRGLPTSIKNELSKMTREECRFEFVISIEDCRFCKFFFEHLPFDVSMTVIESGAMSMSTPLPFPLASRVGGTLEEDMSIFLPFSLTSRAEKVLEEIISEFTDRFRYPCIRIDRGPQNKGG